MTQRTDTPARTPWLLGSCFKALLFSEPSQSIEWQRLGTDWQKTQQYSDLQRPGSKRSSFLSFCGRLFGRTIEPCRCWAAPPTLCNLGTLRVVWPRDLEPWPTEILATGWGSAMETWDRSLMRRRKNSNYTNRLERSWLCSKGQDHICFVTARVASTFTVPQGSHDSDVLTFPLLYTNLGWYPQGYSINEFVIPDNKSISFAFVTSVVSCYL